MDAYETWLEKQIARMEGFKKDPLCQTMDNSYYQGMLNCFLNCKEVYQACKGSKAESKVDGPEKR